MKILTLLIALIMVSDKSMANEYYYPVATVPLANAVPIAPLVPVVSVQQVQVVQWVPVIQPQVVVQPVWIQTPVVAGPPGVVLINQRWVRQPCFPCLFPRY